jgi:hypothetical protein
MKTRTLFFLITAICMMSLGLLTNASGALNDTLDIRPGQFIDPKTGFDFSIDLEVAEGDNRKGLVTFHLKRQSSGGPGLICSANGPFTELDFNTGIGNNPLLGITCGTAGGMPVAIKGCKARLEFHGYAHIHNPKVTYMGMTTIELLFKKSPGIGKGKIQFKVYTPKNKVIFKGVINDVDGVSNIDMSSCP